MPEACDECEGVYGVVEWSATRDADGHREYKVTQRVKVSAEQSLQQGPAAVFITPGLPIPGTIYNFYDDEDSLAVCQYNLEIQPEVRGERSGWFLVTNTFSTRPNRRCLIGTSTDLTAQLDPLAEPPVINGGFVRYTKEVDENYNGTKITNSAHEKIRGPIVEFDANRLTIRIQRNESVLDLPTKAAYIDTVNAEEMWELPARSVKLSNITWEELYDANCDCYVRVTYEFEHDPEGFDRETLDEATKVLNGYWHPTTGVWTLRDIGLFGFGGGTPDPTKPDHFIRWTDINGTPMRGILNGAGIPSRDDDTGTYQPGSITIAYYPEVDFITDLDIPLDIDCTRYGA